MSRLDDARARVKEWASGYRGKDHMARLLGALVEAIATATNGGGGNGNVVTGDAASVGGGSYGLAWLTGEESLANGQTEGLAGAVGNRQAARMVLRGDTPGLAPDETVELFGGNPGGVPTVASGPLLLLPGKAYIFLVNIVAVRVGVPATMRSFVLHGAVTVDALGVVTIVGQSVISTFGSAPANLYTATTAAGAGPSRLSVLFRTGAGNTHAARAVADATWVEVLS